MQEGVVIVELDERGKPVKSVAAHVREYRVFCQNLADNGRLAAPSASA